jgi:glycosyltransferase involved in cell wall biosynthesis
MVAPRVRRFLSRNPDVDFHAIGQNYLAENKIEGRWTPWSADLFDYYRTIDFDIGIAPLIPSRFNRSKSAIKALEYAALGIPVIASDEAPYQGFVVDGVTGFLGSRDHEWEARLRDLVNDEDMRLEMGRAAKERARKWAISEGWKLWADAYRSL